MVDPSVIVETLDTLQEATRRPLFHELVRFEELRRDETTASSSSSWIQLITEAMDLYPYMTVEQRGRVWRCTAVMLLALVLPHQQHHASATAAGAGNPSDLEERLARATPIQRVVRGGGDSGGGGSTTTTDPRVGRAWHRFVHEALTRVIVAAAPDDDDAADLLHVLASCITPRVNRLELDLPSRPSHHQRGGTEEEDDAVRYPAVERLFRLAACPTAAYFRLHDGQRADLVETLCRYWSSSSSSSSCVTTTLDDDDDEPSSLAWTCGMAHLRAGVGAWARRHYTPYAAWALLPRLTSSPWTRAWNTTLHQLVGEDRMEYHSNSSSTPATATTSGSSSNGPMGTAETCVRQSWMRRRSGGIAMYYGPGDPRPLPLPGCPHVQRGSILATLLFDSVSGRQHDNRHHDAHMVTALTELGDAVEWVLDAWTVDDDDDNKATTLVPCLAASLLNVTAVALSLVNPHATKQSLAEVYENVLKCSVQFLRHDDAFIRRGAVRVLEHAWTSLGLPATPYASVLLKTLRQIPDSAAHQQCHYEWKRIVGILSRAHAPFARELATSWQDSGLLEEHVLVSVVATNQPGVFAVKDLDEALRKTSSSSSEEALSLVASLLAARQSHYFDAPGTTQAATTTWGRVQKVLEGTTPWNQYRMATFALINGEYDTATRLFEILSHTVADRKHYLWIQTLTKVARAECILSKQAALGIPSAGVLLHDAIAYLDGLQTRHHEEDYSFQIRFLLLRLDILDLVTVLRQILREMRLTGQLPAKGTRTFSHVPSIFRSFLKLAKQFMDLDKRFGLVWQSRRTSSCLASFRDLAFFLAQTTRAAFGPILPAALTKLTVPGLSVNLVFPMNELIRELDTLVVQPFIKSGGAVDAKTISMALLQVLDGILMVPIPLPRDFCTPLPVVALEWRVRPDALHVAEMGQSSFDVVESFPSLSPTVCVEGIVSNAVKLQRPIRTMILSYQIRYIGPLEEDGGPKDAVTLPAISNATNLALNRRGEFGMSFTLPPLLKEGWFELETILRCQAVDGRVYNVAVSKASSPLIRIRNCRSR